MKAVIREYDLKLGMAATQRPGGVRSDPVGSPDPGDPPLFLLGASGKSPDPVRAGQPSGETLADDPRTENHSGTIAIDKIRGFQERRQGGIACGEVEHMDVYVGNNGWLPGVDQLGGGVEQPHPVEAGDRDALNADALSATARVRHR